MSKTTSKRYHVWTLKEIEQIHKLWDSSTPEEVAEAINVPVVKVRYIVSEMRKEGIKLIKKYTRGTTRSLIKEYKASL